jgi:hypothetical protein
LSSTKTSITHAFYGYIGQEFQVDEAGYLYSISIIIQQSNGNTLTMRWGPSSNLSSTYYGEVEIPTSSGDSNTTREAVFADTTHQLSASTTYYWGITNGGETGAGVTYRGDDTGPYAYGRYIEGSAWNLSSAVSGLDMSFTIKLCD